MPAPRIKVLSNRADLVSGGDALVRVKLPRGVRAARLRLTAGHRNVTRALRRTGRAAPGRPRARPAGRPGAAHGAHPRRRRGAPVS